MTWHVLCAVGPNDTYPSSAAQTEPQFRVGFQRSQDPHRMRENVISDIEQQLGSKPNDTTMDLLHCAMAIYAADMCIPRSTAGDMWSRDIAVHLPVSDVTRWRRSGRTIVSMLNFLTCDNWQVEFRQLEMEPRHAGAGTGPHGSRPVGLFSGGLDSLVGAIDLLEQGNDVVLVGHHGAGITLPVQQRVRNALSGLYGGRVRDLLFWVAPPHIAGNGGEPTSRARSFLFLALGIVVANAVGEQTPVHIAENGLISLNVPLTNSRCGSLSTRTTHPHFIALLRNVLARLGITHNLILPYRFLTKGAMLERCANRAALEQILPLTMSCSHPEAARWQGGSPHTHCGYCIPCIIRRAASFRAGITDAEYDVDIVRERLDPRTQRGRDIRAVSMALERFRQTPEVRAFFDVISSGPIPPDELPQYADVYRRGLSEVDALLRAGPETHG